MIEEGPEELAWASHAHAWGQDNANALDQVNDELTWAPPIPDAGKVIGVAMKNGALNVGAHVEPDGPMFFLKPTSSLIGDGATIEIRPDYGFTFPELELAVVIGTTARNVGVENALDYVFGYSIINDVTSQGLKKGDSIATITAHASRYFTLQPGDNFSCGTAARGTKAFPRGNHEIDMSALTPEVSIEIDRLGRLSNRVTHVAAT